MGHKLTLRQRLILLAALALLPALLIILYSQAAARALRLTEVETYAARMAEAVESEMVRGVTGAATLMIAIGEASGTSGVELCDDYLARVRAQIPSLLDVVLFEPSGVPSCRSGVSSTEDLIKEFADMGPRTLQERFALGLYTRTPEGAALPMGMAIADESGATTGHLVINVGLIELEQLVLGAGLPEGAAVTVADREGTVLFHLPPAGALTTGDSLPEDLRSLLASGEGGSTRLIRPTGERMIAGFRTLEQGLPVSILFEFPEAQALAPVNRSTLINALIAGAGALVAMLFALSIGRLFVREPVDRLMRTLSARRAGDESIRTGLHRDGSELGQIGREIDMLFDEIDERASLQRATEEQRDLMAREVQHRVKNLLAVIQAIARQTLARRDAPPQVSAFEKRIAAIIRAHSTLLSEARPTGGLAELIEGAVRPFVPEGDGRLCLEGPAIRVNPKAGLALALAFHELATNAAKYGSLGAPDGRVAVQWGTEGDQIVINWREEGGPPVQPPEHTGFGMMLIRRVLEGETRGRVTTDFGETGFAFRLRSSLNRVTEAPVG